MEKIEYLGCVNGFTSKENAHLEELKRRWAYECDNRLGATKEEKCIGRCLNYYKSYFADGTGFSYEVDSSD